MMQHQIRNALQANLVEINSAMEEIQRRVIRHNALNDPDNEAPSTTVINFQLSDGTYPYHQLLLAKANVLNGLAALKAAEMKK